MALAPGKLLAERIRRVRGLLTEVQVDALVVTHLPNVRYLTNFVGTSGALVLTTDELWLIVDSRYVTSAERLLASSEGPDGATLEPVTESYDETLFEVVLATGAPRVGFEADHLTFGRHAWFVGRLEERDRGSCRPLLVPTTRIVERLRVVKDAFEIDRLRFGARLISEVARLAKEDMLPGRSEREVAMSVDWAIREAGFDGPAFETIVASGPNSAKPHARPSERRLSETDLVLLDFGGVYDGYCLDLTRTLYLGAIDQESARIYAAVAEAQAAAIAAVRPGAAATAVDHAARETLARHGLGHAFGHGTGHGLGIEVHEEPRISRPRTSGSVHETLLEPGMVFTIEPGAYLPGWGGVRIEDDVLVTADGCEVLTDVPSSLQF